MCDRSNKKSIAGKPRVFNKRLVPPVGSARISRNPTDELFSKAFIIVL